MKHKFAITVQATIIIIFIIFNKSTKIKKKMVYQLRQNMKNYVNNNKNNTNTYKIMLILYKNTTENSYCIYKFV